MNKENVVHIYDGILLSHKKGMELCYLQQHGGFPDGSAVKNLPAVQEPQELWIWSVGQDDPLEEGMGTHSSILPGESHGQGSLAGYSPQDRKGSDMTEAT